MASCSSSVATDQTDRGSNFSVISSLSQVAAPFPYCLVGLLQTLNSSQLHELSTINGVEEDLLASVRREDGELARLHGAKEEAKPVRRISRVRPRLHVKTEQVSWIDFVLPSFYKKFQQRSLAAKEQNHLERRMKEAAWQGETITQLKRRELFLTRFNREKLCTGLYSLVSGRRAILNLK